MRIKAKIQLVALFMIVLMLTLPVAFAQNMTNMTAGNETITTTGEIPLDAVAPLFSKDKYITIEGTTAPNARIEFYIGPTKIKVSRAKSDGTFKTTRVPMIKKGDNDLLIKASIEDKAAQKVFTINYDPVPPNLKVDEIPEFTTITSLQVHGDITEPVTIKYTSYPKKDEIPPDQVSGFEIREIKKNQVTMVWTPSDALDFLEYSIYRNDKRIGIARSAIFVDNDVASGKEYIYRISAIDTSCNEGVRSVPKKALTPPGGSDEEKTGVVPLSCAPTYQTLETAVPFDITLPLQAGGNIVEITASDKAGNTAKVKQLVTVDIGPPQFITTNLDAIGTTYIPEVTIKGNVSEKASVFVYINNEANPSHFGLTDDNGGFAIPIKLKSDVEVQAGSATELDTGVGWQNKIKLKAVDLAGQEAWYPGPQQTKDIIWAMCGYGSWLDFDVEEITPTTVTPRLLMQGTQQLGIPFTLKYIGGQDDAEIAGVINAVPVRISPDLEDAFDNEKISQPQVWIRPRPGQKGVWDGFVQVNFAEWPIDQLDLEGNSTPGAIEAAISDWRRGEFHEAGWGGRGAYLRPGCLNPALGCVKLYMEIDIPLKEKSRIYDPQTMQERFEWKTVRQRNCLPIILEIDQVIPADVIRKGTLEGVSNFMGKAIDLIDKILDPLTTFTENMVYLCLGSTAALFLLGLYKRFTCSKIYLAKGVDMNIAEAGLCEMAYTEEIQQAPGEGTVKDGKIQTKRKEDDEYSSCKGCQNALKNYRNFLQDVYAPICDRTACPSAPTVQKYIIDKRGTLKDITSSIQNKKIPVDRQNDIIDKWGVEGKVFSGNSCGFSNLISTSYTVTKQGGEGVACTNNDDCKPGLLCLGGACTEHYIRPEDIRPGEVYSDTFVKGPESTIPTSFDAVTGAVSTGDVLNSFATGSAVAGADEKTAPTTSSESKVGAYSTNTICGLDIKKGQAPLGADGKIGIKEIYEIYKGDYAGLKEKCTDPSFHPACPLCCGIEYMWEWNSACGVGNFLGSSETKLDVDTFDELKASTKLAAEKVGRGDDIGSKNIFNFLSGFCTSKGNPTPDVVRTGLNYDPKIQEAEENLMQVFVFPKSGSGNSFKYNVYSGYLAKTFVIENALKDAEKKKKLKIKASDRYSFSKTLEAVKEKDLTKHFQRIGTTNEKADISAFTKDLCDRKFSGSKSCRSVASKIYGDVKSHIGTVDQEYIIKPSSGIIDSVRCICLTSLVAFLEQWRQIAQAIKNCIDVIILTGDGDEGICRAMLSNYVCDLLWEIITCFANKWNTPSGKRLTGDVGVGDVLGILTGAGTDMSNNVKGRYGETSMFNAMFNEKEIVHGLCLLAFGFEWNLDVSAMVQQSVESVPVDTIVLGPVPAQSRFIAWNPVTNPRGLTTWEYHFGLMISAGADINTRIKLKCSTGFNCRETDGFVGGECDCNKLGDEKVVSITPICKPAWKNRVNKNELMSYDCTYMVQQGKYRFDTMIFEYDWQDPGTKERVVKTSTAEINRVGSSPPGFCRFDTFSLSFRCKFGESPSGIRIEKVAPKYEYSKDNKEVFAMDKDLDFDLSIKQIMPEAQEDMAAGVKFLGYKILNSANKVVKELDPKTGVFEQTHQLKTDGSYKETISITSPQEGWQFAKGGASGSRYLVDPWTDKDFVTNKIKADVSKYIDGISIKATKDGASALPTRRFVVDIQSNMITLYVARDKQDRGSYVTTKDNILKPREKVVIGKRYTYTYTDSEKKVDHEITFRLKSTDSFVKTSQVQFVIRYLPGTAVGDPCISKKPVTWKVTFTSYDADKYGRVTDQKSVDPMTGETQEKTIPFNIICENAIDLPAKGAAATPGASIFKLPWWFVDGVGVIDMVSGVTLPLDKNRLYVGTFGKGSVVVEVTETGGDTKTHHMQSVPIDSLPKEIQEAKEDIKTLKEAGDLFFTDITLEKGKTYTFKITFRQPDADGKVVDTKTYTAVKFGEVHPGITVVKVGDTVLQAGKTTIVPSGVSRFTVPVSEGITSIKVKEPDSSGGFHGIFGNAPNFWAEVNLHSDREYTFTITAYKGDKIVGTPITYTVKAKEVVVVPVHEAAPAGLGEITNIELVVVPYGKKVYQDKSGKNYVFHLGLDTDTFELRVYAKGLVTGIGYAGSYKSVDKLDPYFVLDTSKGYQVLGSGKQITVYDKDDRTLDSAWIKYDHAIKKVELYDGIKKLADLSTSEGAPTPIEKGKTYTLRIETIPADTVKFRKFRIPGPSSIIHKISSTSFQQEISGDALGKEKFTLYIMEKDNPTAVAIREYWYEVKESVPVVSKAAPGEYWLLDERVDGRYVQIVKVKDPSRGLLELKYVSKKGTEISLNEMYLVNKVNKADIPAFPDVEPNDIYMYLGSKYKIRDVYPGQVEIVKMSYPEINYLGKFISGAELASKYTKLEKGQFWKSILIYHTNDGLQIVDTLPDVQEDIKLKWTTGKDIGKEKVTRPSFKEQLICTTSTTCSTYAAYGKLACETDPCKKGCKWSGNNCVSAS